jgi:lipopolysaccharide/colanic/teichoic acid biosynthesis glycosyltransferase
VWFLKLALKRFFDILLSAGALIALSPVLLLLSLGVVLDSGFPILFAQIRVGRNFRRFHLWKIRSMRCSVSGPLVTISGDPRVTRFGRWMRANKLDELPQFWNVVRGDMSLVGPRPEVPEYVERFRQRYERILAARPGVTDLASIRFCNEEQLLAASEEPHREYVERVLPIKLDLADEYLQTACFSRDISILVQTALVMFRKHL